MSKKILLGTICSALFLGMAATATAQTGVAPELLNPVDPRASGMGLAGTAVGDNPFGIFGNAAANIFNDKAIGAGYSYNPTMNSTQDENLATHAVGAYWNINENNGLSLGFRYFKGPKVDFSDAGNNPLGYGRHKDMAISLAYTRKIIDGLSASLTARYINADYTEFPGMKSGNAFSFDLGVYYTKAICSLGEGSNWALGLNVSNVGTELNISTPAAMPAYARIGGSANMVFSENHILLAALDLGYTFMPSDASSFVAGLGVEYNFLKYGMIRAGYHYGDNKSIPTGQFATVGAGVKYGPVRVDFSYWLAAKDSPVKNTWSVGLGLFF